LRFERVCFAGKAWRFDDEICGEKGSKREGHDLGLQTLNTC